MTVHFKVSLISTMDLFNLKLRNTVFLYYLVFIMGQAAVGGVLCFPSIKLLTFHCVMKECSDLGKPGM